MDGRTITLAAPILLDQTFKRVIDVSVSAAAVLLTAPVLMLIAAAVVLDSRGPVFHRSLRVGKNARPFRIYKFRTMVVDAERNGPAITVGDDPRITRIGGLLRQWKLDELPQLLNVLKGDMSMVGPRPEDPRYVALYTPAQREVLKVRPGITSAASIAYRHESALLLSSDWERCYVQTILPAKLAIDLDYLSHRTWSSDFRLILQTIAAIFTRQRVPS